MKKTALCFYLALSSIYPTEAQGQTEVKSEISYKISSALGYVPETKSSFVGIGGPARDITYKKIGVSVSSYLCLALSTNEKAKLIAIGSITGYYQFYSPKFGLGICVTNGPTGITPGIVATLQMKN